MAGHWHREEQRAMRQEAKLERQEHRLHHKAAVAVGHGNIGRAVALESRAQQKHHQADHAAHRADVAHDLSHHSHHHHGFGHGHGHHHHGHGIDVHYDPPCPPTEVVVVHTAPRPAGTVPPPSAYPMGTQPPPTSGNQ